ncbi:hypothetical protein [Alicyclobacillus fastidiosus]|uniref:Uncharacterized protein n=1 Tax=Alicyclobacillus fastidiosus TaxID=392011 RepID=A0ABV5AK82_9BACL|nr:hypothetical protein [Alicyclobacillus fastidiosus]WEH09284.1 hypothetical protein PYS47_21850 [Alicyclobacillus fastidiosus]
MTDGRVLSEEDIREVERGQVFAGMHRRAVIDDLIATIRDLQRQVSELTEERNDYKAALERISNMGMDIYIGRDSGIPHIISWRLL